MKASLDDLRGRLAETEKRYHETVAQASYYKGALDVLAGLIAEAEQPDPPPESPDKPEV